MAVLLVAQIQQRLIIHDPGGHRRHGAANRTLSQKALLHQPLAGNRQGDIPPGHRGRPGAAVPLEHITVHGDGPLPQGLQIHRRPEAAADKPLDLRAAGTELELAHIPPAPLPVGPGQHGVLRRDPPGAIGHMVGRPLLHTGAAEHLGIAAGDEHAPLGKFHEVGDDLDLPQLIIFTSVNSFHISLPFHDLPQGGRPPLVSFAPQTK